MWFAIVLSLQSNIECIVCTTTLGAVAGMPGVVIVVGGVTVHETVLP